MIPPCKVLPAREQRPLSSAPFHSWDLPGEVRWAEFHRLDAGILVRFPGLADFEIASEGEPVVCRPAPGVGRDTHEHLFINQVMPLVIGRQEGKLAFHASAVVLEQGAIAFLGESGRGKSTLAAAFVAQGHSFLTDDCLIVSRRGGVHVVEPGHPSLRLWSDSHAALPLAPTRTTTAAGVSPKARMILDEAHHTRTEPLLAAFYLSDAPADAVSFAPIPGAEALSLWLQNAFVLDPEDKDRLAAHFALLGPFADRVPLFSISYPRCFERLPDTIRAILAQAGETTHAR